MLANKIMVFLGMALIAILIIENMVFGVQAYLFWMGNSKVWIVALVTAVIGFFMGFGFKGIIDSKETKYEEDTYDF